jgi:hypothetical protein
VEPVARKLPLEYIKTKTWKKVPKGQEAALVVAEKLSQPGRLRFL